MNGEARFTHPKTLTQWASVSLLGLVLGCASSGPQRYRSFFQAVELAKQGERENAREAFQVACSQNSSAACHHLGRNAVRTAPVSILQGATEETATEVILLLPEKQEATVFLWDVAQDILVEPRSQIAIEVPGAMGRLIQSRYEGLTVGTRYQLQVVGMAGELLDARELQTLDLSKKKAVLAVASCMDNRNELSNTIWSELLSQDPEAIFLIGDNVYADTETKGVAATPEQLWKRYAETRRDLSVFKQARLVPIFAVWDDHDFGQNDGNRNYPYKAEAKAIFQNFFGAAQYPGVFDRGPGVASRLNGFGQKFFFLDVRTFRGPPGDKSLQAHYGIDQESWLFTELFGDAPTWLIEGDQFFGGYHKFESYEGNHPVSFRRLLQRLKGVAAPILFLSGDRHLAELMEIPQDILGYKTYELTTSSIHATVYPGAWDGSPNPRKIEGVAGVNNYAILETDATQGLTVHVRVYGPEKRKLFSRTLEVRK